MRIGYGRVSNAIRTPTANTTPSTAGCDEVFVDKASGKLARRPKLDEALHAVSASPWFRSSP